MAATIQFLAAPTLSGCLAALPLPAECPIADLVILPSSLKRQDQAAQAVRGWLRTASLPSHLLVPEPVAAALLKRRQGVWTILRAPTVPPAAFQIPSQLATASAVWTVTDIDATGGRGPYVLDLPIRYAHPVNRLKFLGSRQRTDLAVSLFLARPIQRHLIVRHFADYYLMAVTTDHIAAELVCLSLVDEDLTSDHQVTGPWEDDFVQRATELELGARLPSDINIVLPSNANALLRSVLQRILARIGVTLEATGISLTG